MANATPADARAGYEIFLSLGGNVSREEINDRLVQAGYSPISDRTFHHYRRLVAAGFNRYVPINRFDVARAAEPYENLSAKARYSYLESGTGVRVTFPRGRALVDAFGRAERIGEVGALIAFEDPGTVLALQRQRPRLGETLRIDFLDPPRQVDCRVVEVEHLPSVVRIEVEFARLQPIAEYVGSIPLPTHSFRIRLLGDSSPSIDAVGRQVFDLFELVEAARSVVNEALRVSGTDRHASVARVQRLRMSSPLSALIEAPQVVAAVCTAAVTLLAPALVYERWRKKRLENNALEVELEGKRARGAVEDKKSALELKILDAIEDRLDISLGDHRSEVGKAVQREVLQLVEGMAEREVQAIEVKQLRPPDAPEGGSDDMGGGRSR